MQANVLSSSRGAPAQAGRAEQSAPAMTQRCTICGAETRLSHRATVLSRYEVAYLYCSQCGLLQTEPPRWLDEAYSDAIALSDTGLLTRNIAVAMRLTALLTFAFPRDVRCVDAGGGYGVLTRLMRDVGFDFYWTDPFCANLFAKGFEADHAGGSFSVITAFEVMEHLHDPIAFIRQAMAKYQGAAFAFSTQLFDGSPPPLDWPYYSFETGQHVSFYQRRTLQQIADTLGMRLYSSGNFHLITSHSVSPALYRVSMSRLAFGLFPLMKLLHRSGTWPDRQRAMAELRRQATANDAQGSNTPG
jgi:hypothetical protein